MENKMITEKNVNLINFGSQLSDDVIEAMEKEYNIKAKQICIKASLNLKKRSTYIQCHDIIQNNISLFLQNSHFVINLPGLPIFSAFLITEIHALTGKFPIIIECLKDYSGEGIFSDYRFKRLYDLDRERTQSRESYKTNKPSCADKDE
jgi:hypothetical protein